MEALAGFRCAGRSFLVCSVRSRPTDRPFRACGGPSFCPIPLSFRLPDACTDPYPPVDQVTLDQLEPRHVDAPPLGPNTRSAASGLREFAHRASWAVFPLTVYIASRLVAAVFLVVGGYRQGNVTGTPGYHIETPVPAAPSYWQVITNWDGQWYKTIAIHGYPEGLPSIDGQVTQSAFGFYPAYPMICRLVMRVTGLSFDVSAGLVSTILGGVGVILLYRLFVATSSPFVARASLLAFCAFSAAPVLQVAYTESLALVLLVGVLWSLHRHRYLLVALGTLCLGLTRGIAAPLVVVLLVHLALRYQNRHLTPFPGRHRITGLVALSAALVSPFLWPAWVALRTGVVSGYLRTMSAWAGPDAKLEGWLVTVARGKNWGLTAVVVVVLLATSAVLLRSRGHAWGTDLRVWSMAYLLYVLVVTAPSLTTRYLLLCLVPMWPFPETPLADESRQVHWARWMSLAVVVTFGLLTQYVWVSELFTIDGAATSQPFP
jgi:hypothetical protein